MSLVEKLDQLVELNDGETTIVPERGQNADAFQATVSRVRQYEQQGFLIIVREKRESNSGLRQVVRLRVRLTPNGKKWRKDLASQ
jgi:hypothetical protein